MIESDTGVTTGFVDTKDSNVGDGEGVGPGSRSRPAVWYDHGSSQNLEGTVLQS